MPLVDLVNDLHSDDALFWLLTFEDPNSNVTLRAVSNLEDVISRGNTYTAFPFDVTLPPDDGQRIQNLTLSFPNVGRELMEFVRNYSPETPPNVIVELVLFSDPDTVEKRIDFLQLGTITYDALVVNMQLTTNNIFARKTCYNTYDYANFPGLFFSLK